MAIYKKIFFFIFFFQLSLSINSKSSIMFNGVIEDELSFFRSVDWSKSAEDRIGTFQWGNNLLANLRMKSNIGEYITINLSLNISLLSGYFTENYKLLYLNELFSIQKTQQSLFLGQTPSIYNNFFKFPFYYKNTYVGGFELERLSFKVGNSFFDYEMGLLKIASGYSYPFSPMDIFNPKNPYNQKARSEGKLSVVTNFYPKDMWKVRLFTIAPDNPLETALWGTKTGVSTNFSIGKHNFEFLYLFKTPEIEYEKDPVKLGLPKTVNNDFSHIFGFSMKLDVEVGLFLDIIYNLEHRFLKTKKFFERDFSGYEGLIASIGIDYTFPKGKVYLLTQYIFNGYSSLFFGESINDLYTNTKWREKAPIERLQYLKENRILTQFLSSNYLFHLVKIKINDYLSFSINNLLSIQDISNITTLILDIEPIQNYYISISSSINIDKNLFDNSYEIGEFGAKNIGYYNNLSFNFKIKF